MVSGIGDVHVSVDIELNVEGTGEKCRSRSGASGRTGDDGDRGIPRRRLTERRRRHN